MLRVPTLPVLLNTPSDGAHPVYMFVCTRFMYTVYLYCTINFPTGIDKALSNYVKTATCQTGREQKPCIVLLSTMLVIFSIKSHFLYVISASAFSSALSVAAAATVFPRILHTDPFFLPHRHGANT